MILISYEYFLRDWCPFWNVVWSLFSLSEVHILQWGLGRVAAWSAWALETSGLIFYEWYMQAVDRHEWYLFYVYAVEENEQVLDRPWIPKVNFLLVIPLYKKAPILVQGLCLIDWGRSIDTALFPEGMKFIGDSNTVAFRCIEMLEKRPWTFQVDTYGLCGVVHCLLHGSYMEIQKSCGSDSRPIYSPKAPYKRYWNVELWQNLFQTLLNVGSCANNPSLGILRKTFENHLMSTSGLVKKLRQLLLKQSIMLHSRR
jgi:hypothetical protein